MEIWIDRSYVPAGYGWSFPAGQEVRIGVGSFDPRFHVREPTERLADDLHAPAVRYQGNWIPHALRDAAEDGVYFVGDSAGHCLPLTAEGIRTALYFGLAAGRELRTVLAGRRTAPEALTSYAAFSASHATAYRWMLRVQRLIPRIAPRLLALAARHAEQALPGLVVRPLPGDRPPALRGRRPAHGPPSDQRALIRTVRQANAQLPQLSVERTITR